MLRATTTLLTLTAALAATAAIVQAAPAAAIDAGTTPQRGVTEIASYATTTAWVTKDGQLAVRTGAATRDAHVTQVEDLDVGPGPLGTPVAVFTRCTPGCDVHLLDLTRPGAKAMKLDAAAQPGVGERAPTIWRDLLVFARGDATYLAPVDNGRPRKVLDWSTSDQELGPDRMLAYATSFDSDAGNGEEGIAMVDLDRPRADALHVGSQVIGEGSAAGFGALTAQPDGLYYARLFRNGCATPKRTIRRFDVRRRRAAEAPRARAPLATRAATFGIPETPSSEDC